ncbi:hypothetical protein HJFPF1_02459 [Paramyrothecium foliicola]|nr:hypothetical protein HJFPF1_02459 [Paramyrothecium foliicola]
MGRNISFLTIPLDVRLLIYHLVLEPDTFDFVDSAYTLTDRDPQLMHNIKAFNIVSIGTAPHREQDVQSLARKRHDPWILARICQQIKHETAHKLSAISLDDVFFSFHSFTADDLSAWVERVGVGAVSKVRRWGIDSVNWCQDWFHWAERKPSDWALAPECIELHKAPHRDQVLCYRAVSVDLTLVSGVSEEIDAPIYFSSDVSDGRTEFHYDFCIGAQNTTSHMHRGLIGLQCMLGLRQGCLDAGELFMVKDDSSSNTSAVAIATERGLRTLVLGVRGREQYDDERLSSRFRPRESCEGWKES